MVGLTPWMVNMYIQTIELLYANLLEQRKYIFSKLKYQVLRVVNMRKRDFQRQKKLVFNLYRDKLKDIMNNNIDDGVPNRNNLL